MQRATLAEKEASNLKEELSGNRITIKRPMDSPMSEDFGPVHQPPTMTADNDPPTKHTDLSNGISGADTKTPAADEANVRENGTAHGNGRRRADCDNKTSKANEDDDENDDDKANSRKVDNNANRAGSTDKEADDVVAKSTSGIDVVAVAAVDVAALNGGGTPNTTEFLAKNKEVSDVSDDVASGSGSSYFCLCARARATKSSIELHHN